MSEERQIAEKLTKNKLSLAVAESCTGGLVSSLITDVPGSSKYFFGGVTAYSNELKTSLLKVPHRMIKKHGAVSEEVAEAMAHGIKKETGADITAAITGIAGPDGGTEEKPVGLAHIVVLGPMVKRARKVLFQGTREEIKQQFAEAALEQVLKSIN